MKASQNGWTAVFVYGSLRRGLSNHQILTDMHGAASFVGMARVTGRLRNLGPYPGLYRDGHQLAPVVGEIYLVDAAGLARLDRLEGHPIVYRRETMRARLDDSTETDVMVYVFQEPMRFLDIIVPLTQGEYDWVAYIKAKQEAEGLEAYQDRVGGSL